jgi:glutamyl-tRNA synthetase
VTSNSLQPYPRDRPVGRYAPSPTGELHLGNLRTALEAWADCRRRGGIFIMRIEDIDRPRTVPDAEARILDDLRWLGIDWDEGPGSAGVPPASDPSHPPAAGGRSDSPNPAPAAVGAGGLLSGPAGPYRQSERSHIYGAALRELDARGLTYLCTCSRKDLREASAPHDEPPHATGAETNVSEGPIYPGTCRNADATVLRAHPSGAALRFRVDRDPIVEFNDLRLGPQRFDLRDLCGDFIIRRRDGLWAYQFACAVDDALMGVTHVWRGEDLLSSTPRQIAVLRALDLAIPQYGHLPLVIDESGARMCKRDGSCSIQSWRASGITPAEARGRILTAPTNTQRQ